MKNLLFVGTFLLILSSSAAQAANKWWDVNGATDGSGETTGAGTWNTTGLNWTTDSTGNATAIAFATGDRAIFSAGTDATNAFTINTPNALTIGGITVEEGTVSLTGTALTLGTNTIVINKGAGLSIAGSSSITTTAGATLTLDGGMIQNVTTGSAGSFLSTALSITVTTNGGILSYPSANVLNIVQTGTPGNVISGPGSITKIGAGVLAVATACTYTGSTTVTNGELRIRSTANRLPITTDVYVVSPGILNLNSTSQQIGSLSGNGNVGTGSATLTISGTNSTTFYGALSNLCNAGASGVTNGNGKLVKSGSGTITFAGPNDINGSVTLTAGGITVLPGASLCGPICDWAINGGTLTLSNASQLMENLGGSGGTIYLGPGHTLTSSPFSSSTNSGVITGPGGFTYSPTNSAYVQTLNGGCAYTGATTVTKGTLAIGANGAINKSTSINLAAGASLDISATPTPSAIGTNTTLIVNGTGTSVLTNASTLAGPAGGTINLASLPITLNYDGANPALYISQGTLSLSNNPFTINTASSLGHGTYLIAQQNGGIISRGGTFTVAGTAIASGDVGFIQFNGANLNLVVAAVGSQPPSDPANITGVTTLANHAIQLGFSGTPSATYLVQETTNLTAPINWVTISTNTANPNGLFQYTDLDSTNHGTRFYRSKTL